MDLATRGKMPTWLNDVFNPMAPWWKPRPSDPRFEHPQTVSGILGSAGRRMNHPTLPDIIYPRTPDRTTNFMYYPITRTRKRLTKTLTSTAVAVFRDNLDDIIIRESWLADTLSTETGMFNQFSAYWQNPLPPGRFIGWRPTDLSPLNFAIDILDVSVGSSPDDFLIEELDDKLPHLMREQLTVTFKLVREAQHAASVFNWLGF